MSDRTITLHELDRIGQGMPDLTVRHLAGILLSVADVLPPKPMTLPVVLDAPAAPAPVVSDMPPAVVAEPACAASVAPAPALPHDGPVRPYTAAEVETLVRRREAGDSYAAIAVDLERSVESCRARYHKERAQQARTRNPPQLWTIEEDAQLRSLWDAGETMSAIAQVMRRSSKVIQVRRARLGLVPRGTCVGAGPVVVDTAPVAEPVEAQPEPEDPPAEPANSQPAPAAAKPAKAPLAIRPAAAPAANPKASDDRRPQISAIVSALMQLDEDFESSDDLHIVTQRFRGRSWEDIAADLGCDEAAAKARWRAILGCKVQHKGGIVTTQGWSDLMAAARIVAGGQAA